MRLSTVAILLVLSASLASASPLNFINRYMTFFRIMPLFEDWELSMPVGAAMFLSAVAAAQYGYLPVRTDQVIRGVEAINRHWKARSRAPHRYRYRHPRAVEEASLPAGFQSLITALQVLERGVRRYEQLRTDAWAGRRL